MRRFAAAVIGAILGVMLSGVAESQMRESFDAEVPVAPSPVAIDGGRWLIYELHLTNFTREPLLLQKIEILEGGQDRLLASYDSEDIAARLAQVPFAGTGDRIVEPGRRAIMYVEILLAPTASPASLRHRVGYASVDGTQVNQVLTAAVAVRTTPRLALGPPLRGGPWAAIYHWEWPRGHRRVFYALDGRARLPGRFAIDWVLLDDQGREAHGDADQVTNSLGYGVDVLAVANATVADLRADVPESERVSTNPTHPLGEASGNFVALDLGDGRFAVYEHLKPDSIRVTRGERVRRGQVLASLGFTGDSTGPHLHFHVADGASPLLSEGLPFVFESFDKLGRFDDLKNFGKTRWEAEPNGARTRRRERPAPNAVVKFDDR